MSKLFAIAIISISLLTIDIKLAIPGLQRTTVAMDSIECG